MKAKSVSVFIIVLIAICVFVPIVNAETAAEWLEKGYDLMTPPGKYKEALYAINKAIELDQNYTEAYLNRGTIHHILKEYQKAIEDYNKAIKLSPNYAEAYLNRGTVHHALMEYQKAIKDYNKAIELKKDFGMAYYNRGSAYYGLGEYQKAINDWDKAIEIEARHPPPSLILTEARKVRNIAPEKLLSEPELPSYFIEQKFTPPTESFYKMRQIEFTPPTITPTLTLAPTPRPTLTPTATPTITPKPTPLTTPEPTPAATLTPMLTPTPSGFGTTLAIGGLLAVAYLLRRRK